MISDNQVRLARQAKIQRSALTLAARGPFEAIDLYRFLHPDVAVNRVVGLGFKVGGLSRSLGVMVDDGLLVKVEGQYALPSSVHAKPKALAPPPSPPQPVQSSFISAPTKAQLMAGRARPARCSA